MTEPPLTFYLAGEDETDDGHEQILHLFAVQDHFNRPLQGFGFGSVIALLQVSSELGFCRDLDVFSMD